MRFNYHRNYSRRRLFLVALTILAASSLTACVPTDRSVVTADVQVFDENLLGDWKSGNGASDRLTFAKHKDGKSYAVTTYDADGKAQKDRCVFRVMKLGDQHFYELEVRDEGEKEARFAVGRLTIDKDRLTGWTFEKEDAAFQYPEVKTGEIPDGPAEKQTVLAMEPAKVQAFLKAHGKEMTKQAMKVDRVAAVK